MPELPEVQTVVTELNKKLSGKTIQEVLVLTPKLVSVGPGTVSNIRKVSSEKVKQFTKLLQGEKVLGVTRRAKMLIFSLSGLATMFVHLKMTGQLIYEDKVQRKKTGGKYRILNKLTAPLVELPCKFTHVVFTFSDGSKLYYNDVRQFGYLKAVLDKDIPRMKELKEYGPEPLSKEFTMILFFTAVKKSIGSCIKQAIMNPKVVVGIGNIYSDEILFLAGVRPDRVVKTLTEKELKNIYNQIRPVLKLGIRAKGSSVGDFIRTDGSWGKMSKYHNVYGRRGKECKTCASILVSEKIGGRTGTFCLKCQE